MAAEQSGKSMHLSDVSAVHFKHVGVVLNANASCFGYIQQDWYNALVRVEADCRRRVMMTAAKALSPATCYWHTSEE